MIPAAVEHQLGRELAETVRYSLIGSPPAGWVFSPANGPWDTDPAAYVWRALRVSRALISPREQLRSGWLLVPELYQELIS